MRGSHSTSLRAGFSTAQQTMRPSVPSVEMTIPWGVGESEQRQRLEEVLADGGHGGAEEGFEITGGIGVFCDGGLDGLLGDRAGVAEVDQGGEGVVAGLSGSTVVRAADCGGDGDGQVVELVFEFEDDALG